MQATMEPPQPRPRAWQDAGLVTAAAPGSMPWPPAPTPPQQQHHHDHPQQLPALGAFLPTMPPPPLRPQPHAAAAAGPSYAASTATAAATRGAGIVVPLSRPLSKPQPLAGPTAVQGKSQRPRSQERAVAVGLYANRRASDAQTLYTYILLPVHPSVLLRTPTAPADTPRPAPRPHASQPQRWRPPQHPIHGRRIRLHAARGPQAAAAAGGLEVAAGAGGRG